MRPSDRPTPARRGERGFTLLEVMAAVLVLGLLYTVLADVAMDGLRSEGVNRRRAEASLLADQALAVLEANFEMGELLEPSSEEEIERYLVVTELEPVDVTQWLPLDTESADDADLDSLLGTENGEGRIQQATITVEWDEAGTPYRVIRITFLFDKTGLEGLFPAAPSLPNLPNELDAGDGEISEEGSLPDEGTGGAGS